MIASVDHPGGGSGQDQVPAAESPKPKVQGPKLDTANHFEVVIHKQPTQLPVWIKRMDWSLTRFEAINLAAWLVVMAETLEPEESALNDFNIIREEIETE